MSIECFQQVILIRIAITLIRDTTVLHSFCPHLWLMVLLSITMNAMFAHFQTFLARSSLIFKSNTHIWSALHYCITYILTISDGRLLKDRVLMLKWYYPLHLMNFVLSSGYISAIGQFGFKGNPEVSGFGRPKRHSVGP